MNQTEATEVLRLFEESRQLAASGQDRRWRWRPGTLLFPEGRCCYCGQAVRSNRIWVANDGWLRGQLKLEGMFAIWERPNHPHAGTDGSLCTGGADMLTALFFGVNPADPIKWRHDPVAAAAGIKEWYAEMFGHKCGEGGLKAAEGIFAATTAIHRDRQPDCACGCGCNPGAGACPCDCEECTCEPYRCVECNETTNDPWYGPDDERYCEECFNGIWKQCVWCGLNMEVEPDEGEVQWVVGENGRTYCRDHVERGRRVRTVTTAAPMPWAIGGTTAVVEDLTILTTAAPPPTATGEAIRREVQRRMIEVQVAERAADAARMAELAQRIATDRQQRRAARRAERARQAAAREARRRERDAANPPLVDEADPPF